MLGLLSSHFRKQNAPENQSPILKRGIAPAVEFEQETKQAGLLCTDELEVAIARCKKKVGMIARDCRARNTRFRDIEFDLEEDRERCLHGLDTPVIDQFNPSDVLRVTQIFEKPQFFIDGASCSDVSQGAIGDCWFMSAISVVSAMEGLVEKICPARDEEVGVYGFIFCRDSGWVDVIIDDLLYVKIPKFEELWATENDIYHDDKDFYELHARRGSKTLFFGKSETENETWVPLLEKAYAKLHGDYASLNNGGFESEAIEDMTGGLSTMFHTHDILNTDRFWSEQLLRANKDRLFGCYIYGMNWASEVKGLYTMHAYSILDALEVNGTRFLRLRNPWGKSEWKGRWSDGSKEWTADWLKRLPELKHRFGDDGVFLMEYSDFLKTWTMIERSRLFDQDWKLSSMWMNVASRSFPCAWNFGDVSFTVSVPEDTPAVIVLSKLDDRYFSELSGYSNWSLEFVVYKKGAPADEPYARSTHNVFWRRSVNVELDNLEAGEYVIHVRLDREKLREKTYYKDSVDKWNPRKLSKVWAEACLSKSIAVNFNPDAFGDLMPASLGTYGGEDLTTIEISYYEKSQTRLPLPTSVAAPLAEAAINVSTYDGSTIKPEDSMLKNSGDDTEAKSEKKEEKEEKEKEEDNKQKGTEQGGHMSEDKQKEGVEGSGGETSTKLGSADVVQPTSKLGGESGEVRSPEASGMPIGEPGAWKRPDKKNENNDNKEEKDDKDDMQGDKKDGKGNKKDAFPASFDLAGSGAAPVAPTPDIEGPEEVMHDGYTCDECRASPIVGPRYHCLDASCQDYDICPKCMDARKHDPNHQMLCIRNPVDASKLTDQVTEGEDNSITLGLKVYTKGSAVARVAGQLRHGKVVMWKKMGKA